MRKIVIYILLIFVTFTIMAHDSSIFTEVDAHAVNAPASVKSDIPTLVEYLLEPFDTDEEKVRVIFRWVAENIRYDTQSYFSGRVSYSSPDSTLRSGKGVCEGYAGLFKALADEAGLEVVTIHGYAKGYGYQPGQRISGTNHAWNAVSLDGRWYLLDSTWGAGYVNGRNYVKHFKEFYFLTPADQFIFAHLPTDPAWQLLEDPISNEEYEDLVYVRNHIFDYGFSSEDVHNAVADEGGGGLVQTYNTYGTPLTIFSAPLTRNLTEGAEVLFDLYAPGSPGVAVINNGHWVYLSESDDEEGHFTGTVKIKRGVIKLSLMIPGKGDQYWTIFQYQGL